MTTWKKAAWVIWIFMLLVSLGMTGCKPGQYARPDGGYPGYSSSSQSSVPNRKPMIMVFRFDPQQVPHGASSTLHWRTQDADQVYISNVGYVNQNGSQRIMPVPGKVYQIKATNAYGSAVQQTAATSQGSPPGGPPAGPASPEPGGLPIMPHTEGTVGPVPGGSPIIPQQGTMGPGPVREPIILQPSGADMIQLPQGTVAVPGTKPAGQRVIQDPATMRRLDTRQLEQIQMQQPIRR